MAAITAVSVSLATGSVVSRTGSSEGSGADGVTACSAWIRASRSQSSNSGSGMSRSDANSGICPSGPGRADMSSRTIVPSSPTHPGPLTKASRASPRPMRISRSTWRRLALAFSGSRVLNSRSCRRARSTRMDVALPITASAPRARMPRGVKRRLPGPVSSTGPMRRSVRGCMGTIAIGEIRSRCYAFPYGKDTAFSIPLVNEVLPCLFNTANTVNTASMANTVNRVARVGRAL